MCWSCLRLNGHLLFHWWLEEGKTYDLAPGCHFYLEDSLLSFALFICLFNMNHTEIPPSQYPLPPWQDASPPSGMYMESVPFARYVNLTMEDFFHLISAGLLNLSMHFIHRETSWK